MATRFMCKALLTAALAIASSLLLAATSVTSSASSNTAGALQLAPPAAPSHCRARTTRYQDPYGYTWTYNFVSWNDNSNDEDGFLVEEWWKNHSGVWVLSWSTSVPANQTGILGSTGNRYRFRVRAFNASGDSAWSNWGR